MKTKTARKPIRGIDWLLVGVVVGLTLFGLLMVYSAGMKFASDLKRPTDYFIIRQTIFAAVGLILVAVLSMIDYHKFQRYSILMMLFTIILLLIVAVMGEDTLGSTRSIFGGSVRPSELAKLVGIIYVSVWLTAKREVLNDIFLGLFPLMLILGITGGLILLQPDISAAFTIIILGGILFFLAGGAWRQIALTIVTAGLIGLIVVSVSSTGTQRVTEYMAGLRDPMQTSYHVARSLEAVIYGGIFGVGIGHSSVKSTGLPVAPTDSIFAVIAEELGLIGSGLLILAFVVLLWRGLSIARRAPDQLGSLLASGITIWIVIEALINMAVMVNLLPHAGNALPFISYGGSYLLVTLAGVGILMNISRMSDKKDSWKGGGTFGAVVDLRWRDRGRRVSRPGRSSDTRRRS